MSGFDYSKFDRIGEEEEREDQEKEKEQQQQQLQASVVKHPAGAVPEVRVPNSLLVAAPPPTAPTGTTTTKAANGRYVFSHEGRTIYEWEQSLEEVNIYITPPSQVPTKLIEVGISHRHLTVGLRGADTGGPFIDEDTWGGVKVEESMWTLTDGEMYVTMPCYSQRQSHCTASLCPALPSIALRDVACCCSCCIPPLRIPLTPSHLHHLLLHLHLHLYCTTNNQHSPAATSTCRR